MCNRLEEVLGIGPVIASATYAEAGDGKDVLLGISKRGNAYLRMLYIRAARSVPRHSANKQDRFSRWAQAVQERRGYNKACVAVANKLARIAWVIMAKGETYRPAV